MERLVHLAINDEGFVFDPKTGASFTVNSSALTIMRGLQKTTDVQQIAAELAETYGLDMTEAEMDVMDFINQLRAFHVV